jgi:starch-binding outer membrane protein, SusD/RagB family
MKSVKYNKIASFLTRSFLFSAVLLISSCEGFLDQQPRDKLTDEYVQDVLEQGGIENVLNALYWSLNFRWNLEDASNWLFIEALSDNANSGGDDASGFEKTMYFQITPENTFGNRWGYYYKIVTEANNAIKILYNLFDKEGTSAEMAEAKFYRAWAYFELARSFGGVILLDENSLITDEAAKTRASLEDTYQFVIDDLQISVQNLPDNRVGTRPIKWTAKALLGKVYLYTKDWANAKTQLMDVVNNGPFLLEANFSDVYQVVNEKSMEMVFTIDCTDKGLANWGNSDWMMHGNNLFGFCGPLVQNHKDYNDGWGYGLPTQRLVDAFDAAGDEVRKAATILTMDELKAGVVDENGNLVDPSTFELEEPIYGWEGYYCRKVVPLKEYQSSSGEYYINYPQDYIIMRYSEVLLMAAEACLQTGSTGEGQPLFDQVRSRVGLTPLNLTIENLLAEKRLELAMEGERFFDLVRYNKASEALGYKGFEAGKHEVFAIP